MALTPGTQFSLLKTEAITQIQADLEAAVQEDRDAAELAALASGSTIYASLAAGEAATADGGIFMVIDGSSAGVLVYQMSGGSGVLQGSLGGLPTVSSTAALKGRSTANSPVLLTEAGKEGIYAWMASYNRQRALADNVDEHRVISPNVGVNGAWVRINLSEKERLSINKNKRRVYEESWPQLSDLLNTTFLARHPFGGQINFNSASEDLSEAHYGKDCTLGTETMDWNGVKLQRIHTYSFVGGLRDLRNADYDLEDGVLYVASAFVAAPREIEDDNGLRPPNTFTWMQAVPNGTTYGHGAKLAFPTPRRVWCVIQGGSAAKTTKAVDDPTVAWASQSESSTDLRWVFGGAGIGPTTAAPELWIGGMQIERAPNQSEKVGWAVVGTSIDVLGGGTGDGKSSWASSRAWPRWLEGLLCAPIFDCSIGGQTSTQIDTRFNSDVAPVREHAKYLVLAANVNDFNNAFDSATYRANWASIYSKALAAGWDEDEIIWMTINPRSVFDYAGGAADIAAENEYIKDTYRNVIDRAELMADAIDEGLLPEDWESDGIHGSVVGNRALAFMIYKKYRHFFRYDNVPGPYQKTLRSDGGIQPLVEPAWLNMLKGAQVSSTAATATREAQDGTAPVVEFNATLTGNTTYQMPVPYYHGDGGTPGADPTEWQVQRLFNNTTGGFNVTVQYYKRPGGTLSTVGSGIGPIPPGECWTVMTNGVTAVRVQ